MSNMTLLEYLVPSRARRELLKAVWHRKEGLSVRQLALRSGVAYSNTHREAARMEQVGLLRRRKSGKSLLCSWNPASPAAKALSRVLEETHADAKVLPEEETLFWNLKRWGAPLTRTGKAGAKLSLEDTLAFALDLARRHPDVARVWSVVLAKNRSAADMEALVRRARHLGQKRTLGFFLSLTGELLNDPSLKPTECRLRDGRFRRTVDFFTMGRGKRARELAERRTPRPAREWGFRMNMPLESFRATFDKFAGHRAGVRR